MKRLDAFDEALSTELDDARFSSGVPAELRADDDEFLLMAGLASTDADATDDGANDADVDTSRPMSFHEDGVEDVDGSYADASVAAESIHDELSADVYAATPRADLRALIAGLSRPTSGEAEPIPSGPPGFAADDIDEAVESIVREAPEGTSDEAALEGMLDRVKGDILAGLRADLSALTHAQEEVAAGQREAAAALAEQRAAVIALQRAQEAAQALDAPRAPVAARAEASPVAELAEAERLIQELRPSAAPESAPPAPHDDRIDLNAIPSGAGIFELDEPEPETGAADRDRTDESDSSVYNQPRRDHVRRSSRLRRRRRRIVLSLASVAVAAALFFAALLVMPLVSQRFVGPESLGATAADLMKSEQYVQASNTYRQLLSGFPEAPGAEHAAFMAGYALACIPQGLGERHYSTAIQHFEEFEQRYPESEKTGRSQLMRGVLHHRIGNHVDAITLLSAIVQSQGTDPSAVLPALRTLARAHAARGEFDAARSKLMQVISLPDNFSLDRDYEELAALNATQAAQSADPAAQAQWASEAERYYQLALALPSIEPARKRAIELGLAELSRMRRDGFPARGAAEGAGFTATTEIGLEPDLAPPATEQIMLPEDGPAPEATSVPDDIPAEEGSASAPDTTALEDGLRDAAAPAEAPLTMEALPDLDEPASLPGEGESP